MQISWEAANTEPSCLGIAPGDPISIREALRGMMVVSGNDAAVAVAQTLGGSVAGYAEKMNQEAVKMGATHTNLATHSASSMVISPSLSSPATAIDMAKMAAYGMKNFPEFRYIVGLKSYDVKYMDGREPKHVTTTNHFLTSGYPGANGVKTGFTNAAGECLVASATRDGHTLVFIEVKTRTTGSYGLPCEAVEKRKRRQITRVASAYLAQFDLWERPCRFDVIEVWPGDNGQTGIRHIAHAFLAERR